MADDLNLDTQGEGDGSAAGNGAGGAGADNSQNQDFLVVNDRTKYRTSEDAIRGWNEAQGKITSFSPIERVLEKFYGKDGIKPELIDQHLSQLVKSLEDKKAAEAAEAAKGSSEADTARFAGKSADEIKQIKAAEQWFRDQAEKNGYVSKDSVKKLEEKLAALEAAPDQNYASSQTEMVNHSRQQLQQWLTEGNVQLNEAEVQKLANRIQGYVDGDPDNLAAWQSAVKRGDAKACEALVREATEIFLPTVKKGAALVAKAAGVARAGTTKAALVASTRKPLPQGGAGREGNAGRKPGVLPQHRGIRSPELAARALALLNDTGE